jgi:hypothetical protein
MVYELLYYSSNKILKVTIIFFVNYTTIINYTIDNSSDLLPLYTFFYV